jgi:hypothetical protein
MGTCRKQYMPCKQTKVTLPTILKDDSGKNFKSEAKAT